MTFFPIEVLYTQSMQTAIINSYEELKDEPFQVIRKIKEDSRLRFGMGHKILFMIWREYLVNNKVEFAEVVFSIRYS